MAYEDILEEMRAKFAVEYSPNYLVSIVSNEVPKKIAQVAKTLRLEQETPPEKRKKCIHCGRSLPMDPIFFSRNNAHKDGLSNTCKECDRNCICELTSESFEWEHWKIYAERGKSCLNVLELFADSADIEVEDLNDGSGNDNRDEWAGDLL